MSTSFGPTSCTCTPCSRSGPGCCRRPAPPVPGSWSPCTTSGGCAPASSWSTATSARARLVVEAGVCACEVDVAWRRQRAAALATLLGSADLVLAPSAVGRPGAGGQRRGPRPPRGRRERPARLGPGRFGRPHGAPPDGRGQAATGTGPLRLLYTGGPNVDEGRRRAARRRSTRSTRPRRRLACGSAATASTSTSRSRVARSTACPSTCSTRSRPTSWPPCWPPTTCSCCRRSCARRTR